MFRFVPSIRHALLALPLVSVLPIVTLGVVVLKQQYQDSRAQMAESVLGRARAISGIVDEKILSIQTGLEVLSTSSNLRKGDLPRFHERASTVRAQMGVADILVITPAGDMVMSAARDPQTPPTRLPNPPLLERTIKTQVPGVSGLFMGVDGKRHLLTVAVPVITEGQFQYSLNALLTPQILSEVIATQRFPEAWRVGLIEGSGRVAARNVDADKYVGQLTTPELRDRINASTEGVFESQTLDQIKVLAAHHRSELTGWTITIGIPVAELEQNINQQMLWLLELGLIALLLGQWVAWWIASKISDSMQALTEPAAALAQGHVSSIPPLRFKEANDMRSALVVAGEKMIKSQYAAHHDPLTGLANRSLFTHQVEQGMALCRRQGESMAVLFMDLDGFKAVNDSLGHATGDDLLRSVADRLRHGVRESDVVARFGGDEFAVLLMHVDPESAQQCAQKLIAAVSAPYALERGEARISVSIGIAIYPGAGEDAEDVMQTADEAMYDAKRAGKGRTSMGASDVGVLAAVP